MFCASTVCETVKPRVSSKCSALVEFCWLSWILSPDIVKPRPPETRTINQIGVNPLDSRRVLHSAPSNYACWRHFETPKPRDGIIWYHLVSFGFSLAQRVDALCLDGCRHHFQREVGEAPPNAVCNNRCTRLRLGGCGGAEGEHKRRRTVAVVGAVLTAARLGSERAPLPANPLVQATSSVRRIFQLYDICMEEHTCYIQYLSKGNMVRQRRRR